MPQSKKTADVAKEFIRQARELLAGETKANGLTLRGFSGKPPLPSYEEVYGLKAAAIAVYPMYKGLARLVGMDIVGNAQTLAEQMTVLEENWTKYDFFFIHFKYTDSTGEDGNFDAKVKRIEEFDAAVPRITALKPERADRHRRPQHAEHARQPQLAPRADAARLQDSAAPMAASDSAKVNASAAASVNSRRST